MGDYCTVCVRACVFLALCLSLPIPLYTTPLFHSSLFLTHRVHRSLCVDYSHCLGVAHNLSHLVSCFLLLLRVIAPFRIRLLLIVTTTTFSIVAVLTFIVATSFGVYKSTLHTIDLAECLRNDLQEQDRIHRSQGRKRSGRGVREEQGGENRQESGPREG